MRVHRNRQLKEEQGRRSASSSKQDMKLKGKEGGKGEGNKAYSDIVTLRSDVERENLKVWRI